jgi:pyruvate dehydrogenase E1 component alpha subunit
MLHANLYRTMARIRAFENAAEKASQGGVSVYGQEARGSGGRRQGARAAAPVDRPGSRSGRRMRSPDAGRLSHLDAPRPRHTLAKGADLTRMMCELFGKAAGFYGGKGGSMHIADFSVGMLGANGVVAAGLPIAVGCCYGNCTTGPAAFVPGGTYAGAAVPAAPSERV